MFTRYDRRFYARPRAHFPHYVAPVVKAARRPRAVPAGPSNPPACYRDPVGPALAPQTRPEGTQALLWGTCRRALLGPFCPFLAVLGGLCGGHRPRAALGAAPGRRRGLGAAAPAPLERGGAIIVHNKICLFQYPYAVPIRRGRRHTRGEPSSTARAFAWPRRW